ncbi:FAD-dependent oxidoreductase [Niastella yeongjuensis]|uniref:FAD-dependent oxidoreductase n=1 Tax=Niastella yeongjuensis TaxID=354355 RepID=A0A1V9ELL1_9BACT|nr:FAD-dependent monooxygenase [Niastella yeongjuensis]OQP46834.1 FAD-dependent oxidoreductase [Niastella yeongjuensis]SEN56449.1 2-polyprenyl-6-methoxyphenol hydroxylase [Niastella yeongjuensis]
MKATQDHPIHDVIVAGAGPVGLFLACELALANCSVLILEKAQDPHSPLKQLPFGLRGLNALSVEAMYRRGLLQELEMHKRIKTPHVTATAAQDAKPQAEGHFAGIQFNKASIDTSQWKYRLSSSTDTQLFSVMEELETVLTRRAESLGVTIKRGLAITCFQQTADRVTVQAGNQSFEGKWLVGCDGSRSAVRKAGGFEFAGTEPEFTGYSARVDLADPEKLKPGRNVTETGMYLKSQPDYIIMQDFDEGSFHNSGKPVTLEHAQEVLRRISNTDVTITALHVATTWTDRSRQATTYRNGRVLLAGDAAHIHSPLGGQGLNLGLGDAMNLGWKLAATIQNKAPEGLLDSYYTERHPLGIKVLEWSRAQVAIMKPNPHARALNAIFRDLMDTRDGVTYIAGRIWGINTHYSLEGNHPLTGHSVPNFEFDDGVKMGELMFDGEGVLLDFNGNGLLKRLAAEYGLKYISGSAKEQLGITAALVRPDGIIAWASDNNDPDHNELQKAAGRWFKKQTH